jgi:hypothetical protein
MVAGDDAVLRASPWKLASILVAPELLSAPLLWLAVGRPGDPRVAFLAVGLVAALAMWIAVVAIIIFHVRRGRGRVAELTAAGVVIHRGSARLIAYEGIHEARIRSNNIFLTTAAGRDYIPLGYSRNGKAFLQALRSRLAVAGILWTE